METTTESKVIKLKLRQEILENEIKIKEQEIKDLTKEIFNLLFMKITWNELENWLKENDKGKESNPKVTDESWFRVYTTSLKNNELIVGDDYYHSRLYRGVDLYVERRFFE